MESGVIFQNFTTAVPSRLNQSFPTLNCAIVAGKSCIIQAPSGYGKSTLLMALMHILEHTGEIYFIKEKVLKNSHELNLNLLQKKIFFYREENFDKSSRLIDLFQDPLCRDLCILYDAMQNQFGESLTEFAWHAADNLIEQEINHIQQGKQSVFAKDMVLSLIQMRYERYNLVSSYLKNAKGNLNTSQIHPERNFFSLSAGEKRRVCCLLAFEQARTNPDLQLIILDEPLAHLDEKSIQEQIEIIKKIENLPSPPSKLIIAHHFIDKLLNSLQVTNLINLVK